MNNSKLKADNYDSKQDDCLINSEDRNDNDDNKTNAPIDSSVTDDSSETNSNNNNFGSTLTSTIFEKGVTTPTDIQPPINTQEKNRIGLKNNVNNNTPTPSESVTSVTSVTNMPPKYPCYFCGNAYSTNIDFDMELHLLENHKGELLKLPVKGNMDKREKCVISLTKKKMMENSTEDLKNEEESG